MSRDTEINQRPFYMSRLDVDPVDRNRVFFLSENLLETRDGGRTFHEIEAAVHQDHHAMWIARDGRRMIEGNDGSAPISLDAGSTWDWRFNAVIGQIYRAGYDLESPYHVCGGLQDNDSFCGPSNSLNPIGILNSDWRDVGNDGDGSWVWPEPGRPSSIWNVGVSALNGQLGIFDLDSRQNFDISPYLRDTNGHALEGLPYRFNWEAPIAFSPRDPGVAYFGGNVVFATRDRGRTWQPISPDLTRNDPTKQQVAGGPINPDVSGAEFYDTILDIAPSPLDKQVIWVGTDDGLVQVTRDGGAHWQNVSPPGVGALGTRKHGRALARGTRGGVRGRRPAFARRSDAIRLRDERLWCDWRSISAGLPAGQYAHVVREDPSNPDVLYAGVEQGVWISLDRGAHWSSLRLNMPPVSIHDLRVQPRERGLIAATHGRGFWILDDLSPFERLSAAISATKPVFFPPLSTVNWWFGWTHSYGVGQDECCAQAGEFVGPNPDEGALLSYYLPNTPATAPSVEIADAGGQTRAAHRRAKEERDQPRCLGSGRRAAGAVAQRARVESRTEDGARRRARNVHGADHARGYDIDPADRRGSRSARFLDASRVCDAPRFPAHARRRNLCDRRACSTISTRSEKMRRQPRFNGSMRCRRSLPRIRATPRTICSFPTACANAS